MSSKPPKIDVKDRKLLYYLSQEARSSHSFLAKKLNLSKNTVKYRIERLRKDGVIKQFTSVTNLEAMDIDTFTILLRFNEDIYQNPDIINYFRNHDSANWVISLCGHWDLFVEVMCDGYLGIAVFLKETIGHFGPILNTYKVYFSISPLRIENLIADFYKDLELETIPSKKRSNEVQTIDSTDKRILYQLSQDSSLPYLKIAQKLNLTIDIVRYRIKQLIQKGILIKFIPEISLPKLGYTEYLCNISLNNTSQEQLKKLKEYISINKDVTYAFFDILTYSLIFTCAFNSADAIDHLTRNLRKKFSDIIAYQEYLLIKEQILFNLFPKVLLKE